ncbi:MAG: VOC family protein [Bacteroidota bacterium]
MSKKTGKVTGVGGVFFKCKDPQKVKDWYKENLGFETDQYGAMFSSKKDDESGKTTYLQWSPFKDDTTCFEPSDKGFMVNYRVENLEALAEDLKAKGVKILDNIESYDYGKFLHILDIENNKIELWEPVDETFDKK